MVGRGRFSASAHANGPQLNGGLWKKTNVIEPVFETR